MSTGIATEPFRNSLGKVGEENIALDFEVEACWFPERVLVLFSLWIEILLCVWIHAKESVVTPGYTNTYT